MREDPNTMFCTTCGEHRAASAFFNVSLERFVARCASCRAGTDPESPTAEPLPAEPGPPPQPRERRLLPCSGCKQMKEPDAFPIRTTGGRSRRCTECRRRLQLPVGMQDVDPGVYRGGDNFRMSMARGIADDVAFVLDQMSRGGYGSKAR